MQSTQLLDAYLQSIADKGRTTQHRHGPVDSSTKTTQLRHGPGVANATEALDELINVSTNSKDTPGNQQTWLEALAHQRGSYASTSNNQQGPTEPTGRVQASSRGRHKGGQRSKGIFRSMREADAAALLEQQTCASQQQPIFQAPADNTNASVRIMASNAALQAKLQRLQAQMEARSYRQELLQQLHMSGAAFQQSQGQPQQLELPHQQQDMYHWLRSSNTAASGVSQGLTGRDTVTRPTTSPACIGNAGTQHSTTLIHAAGTAASSMRQTPSAAVQHGNDWQHLQHLKELLEYEPRWRPHASASGSSKRHHQAGSVEPGAVFRHSGRQRPWTSMGLSNPHSNLHTSRVSSQPELQGTDRLSRTHEAQQRSSESDSHQVPRPASAVAALEQSLSELALLRSKYRQDQQQGMQQQQQETSLAPTQQQQSNMGEPRRSQQLSSTTWLQTPRLQQLHPAASVTGGGSGGRAASIVSGAATCQAPAAVDPGDEGQLFSHSMSSYPGARQQTEAFSCPAGITQVPSRGYKIWDNWQQQLHNPAAAAGAPGAGYNTRHMVRPMSSSRPIRAWDAMPLHRTSVTGAAYPARNRRCSSPGYSSDGLQRQQQQRPKTAGGYERSFGEQVSRRTAAVRPLGLHNETVRMAPAVAGAEASGMVKPPPVSSKGGRSTSTWLVSSPLLRRQQRSTTTGGHGSVRRSLAGTGLRKACSVNGSAHAANAAAAAAGVRGEKQPAALAAQVLSSMSSPVKVQGRATAAAAQLLRQIREERTSSWGGAQNTRYISGLRSNTVGATAAAGGSRSQTTCTDRMSVGGVGLRRGSGLAPGDGYATGAPAAVADGQGSLTQKVLEYVAKRYKSPCAKRDSDSGSDCDSSSDLAGRRSTAKGRQSDATPAAYAAVLARVKAARAAGHDSDSDFD